MTLEKCVHGTVYLLSSPEITELLEAKVKARKIRGAYQRALSAYPRVDVDVYYPNSEWGPDRTVKPHYYLRHEGTSVWLMSGDTLGADLGQEVFKYTWRKHRLVRDEWSAHTVSFDGRQVLAALGFTAPTSPELTAARTALVQAQTQVHAAEARLLEEERELNIQEQP